MGLFFGWVYTRTKRVGPLVVAHTVLDVVAFVGYALLKDHLSLAELRPRLEHRRRLSARRGTAS